MSDIFYITTPIYYPNGEPHLGHATPRWLPMLLSRYHRLRGDETFFLTGTDEHGIKMVKTAAGAETSSRRSWRIGWRRCSAISGRNWTSPTMISSAPPSRGTKAAVQEIVRRLLANGDIYLGSYEGWYDEGQEEFVTETEAKANEYQIRHQRQAADALYGAELFFPADQICCRGCWNTSRAIRNSFSRRVAAE